MHGLGGGPLKTWTAEGKNDPWLKDPAMLPRALPQARILAWGYDADVVDVMGGTSSDRILQHAHTLISQLHADRSVSAIPVVWCTQFEDVMGIILRDPVFGRNN